MPQVQHPGDGGDGWLSDLFELWVFEVWLTLLALLEAFKCQAWCDDITNFICTKERINEHLPA